MKKLVLAISAALLSAGCASSPDKIPTASVSTLQYKDCDQLAMESDRISRRVNELYMNLKRTADNDSAQMAVGMLLFWPALFFLEGGDGPEAQEYSRLKGEYDAIERVAIKDSCEIAPMPDLKKKYEEAQKAKTGGDLSQGSSLPGT